MRSLLVKPLGGQDSKGEIVRITPQEAGWETISLRVVRMDAGDHHVVRRPDEELVCVMLGGKANFAAAGERWESVGARDNVFAGMPHALYVGAGAGVEIDAQTPCEIAICSARSNKPYPARLIRPDDVEIEIRGGANATRQINHIVKPDFPADRILIVEVYTPSGNWSSYPPHKHDVHNPPSEVDLEEIYYYKIARPEGYAIQRVYTRDGKRNETLTVRDNEVVLIPDGYHPVVAAHGYDCYYLNVLAGSARSMAASDDPDYAWVRQSWHDKDPRLPLVH